MLSISNSPVDKRLGFEAGSGSEDTVVVPEVMEPKLEIDLIPDLRDRASKALMKRADLIPVKRNTIYNNTCKMQRKIIKLPPHPY